MPYRLLLADWADIAINPGAAGEAVTVTDTQAAAPRRFLRLQVR